MSFDGIFTYCVQRELKQELEGGKITKIHQPSKHDLILQIRQKGKNYRLLISNHPNFARIHLTASHYDNPQEPPMFCMVLRKHLEGSIIEEISQVGLDRIVMLQMRSRNELGDITRKQLFVEIMGKHSNIILVDQEKKMIIDSIKHVSAAVNRHRSVLPGHAYVFPPDQGKLNPFHASEETVLKKIDLFSGKFEKQIVDQFAGISPLLAKEIVYRSGIANKESVARTLMSVLNQIKSGSIVPQMTKTLNKEYFYILPLEHVKGERKTFSTISELLDRYFYSKAERDRVKQQGQDLERFIINERKKNETKIQKLKHTLKEAEKANTLQLYGELLTANMHAVKKGDKEVEVINYYDEDGQKIKIPLDPLKTPSENAQSYFQKYQKAKNSVLVVKSQIEKAEQEIEYFDRLLQQLETASPKDLEEIREELIEGGYLKKRANIQKKKNAKPVLEAYLSSDGAEILVGKNNKQNEYLTNRVAARDDIWLHTKDIPGSHVVIRKKDPSEQTILEAANLAAYFSKARQSSSVPVDYTKVRYVKKPNGAKPGFVIYENQQTVYVTPDEELVLKLKKQ
ncbi:MAG: hypothetical protein C6W58_12290 [Bacillaceae bacterium]|jgi:predicted ribosome quality control (RQC) complex YloA/Tae2 family protein|uniref:Rqc2 family fibronectin-binding protein n=1 Tax=Aeribacillus TaxID=1055323 RepID=UPI000E36D8B4|nr:hypothetical protein CX649_09755 [Bacillaceae bacterium ZC4]MED0703303.1 NFACT RNA binding domain-containing protein [Aeribacillus composti]MED1441688.1 NFACT RNA binding domain-containing protein [Aeribacillus composti]REJ14794.1 MAG: hypothetical protein C6W58_12290 [Bacillaceae bacterium]